MYNTNIPAERELPSTAKLIKSTVVAVAVASGLLVTVVMPAEYGIDPTGIGEMLNLKQMGEIKMSLAQEAIEEKQAAVAAATPKSVAAPLLVESVASRSTSEPEITKASEAKPETNAPTQTAERSDEMTLTLAPNEGAEIKVTLQKGKKVTYSWATDGGVANFDVHGDSKPLNIDYYGYYKGKEQRKEGVLEAAFDGGHGWFWRNRTAKPLMITLKINGAYTEIKKY
jgi:hypothetical protein